MTVLVSEEFLITKLKHFRLTLEYPVMVLVCNFNHLIIFLENELRSFDLTLLIEVRQNKQFVERLFSLELGHLRKKELLSSH